MAMSGEPSPQAAAGGGAAAAGGTATAGTAAGGGGGAGGSRWHGSSDRHYVRLRYDAVQHLARRQRCGSCRGLFQGRLHGECSEAGRGEEAFRMFGRARSSSVYDLAQPTSRQNG